jgi:hypothetical protein
MWHPPSTVSADGDVVPRAVERDRQRPAKLPVAAEDAVLPLRSGQGAVASAIAERPGQVAEQRDAVAVEQERRDLLSQFLLAGTC